MGALLWSVYSNGSAVSRIRICDECATARTFDTSPSLFAHSGIDNETSDIVRTSGGVFFLRANVRARQAVLSLLLGFDRAPSSMTGNSGARRMELDFLGMVDRNLIREFNVNEADLENALGESLNEWHQDDAQMDVLYDERA